MNTYKSLIYASCILFISCLSNKKKVSKLPDNPIESLTGTSIKTWKLAKRYNNGTRMNMGDCFLSYRITYKANMTFADNNGEYNDCGPSMIGKWEIITDKKGYSYIKQTSDQIPILLNIDKNYKFFKILKLNKDTLQIQFRHKQFSSKSTFVDLLVRDDINVKDRDFHWN